MGNQNSKPFHQLPKININDQPDGITSISDPCLPDSATEIGSTPHIRVGLLPSISVHPDEITSKSDSCLPLPDTSVGANKPSRLPRKIQFRVLVIGRANAGKTSILQRVCDTTESPVIYQSGKKKKREALDPSMDRGMHDIYNEFVFSGHNGYIFHDSCGFEAGSDKELEIVREFIRRKSRRRRLESRLHAIWYCVPMDNQRPELDLKFLKDICPDKDVPVIVVFTKYDQFLRNVKMHLEDYGDSLNPEYNESEVAEREFKEHYLLHLGDGVGFVRLERLHKPETRCNVLLEETAEALNDDVVALMLLAVQSRDLELSIKVAVKRVNRIELDKQDIRDVIRRCLVAFPQIWIGPNWKFFLKGYETGPISDATDNYERMEKNRFMEGYLSILMKVWSRKTSQSLVSHFMSFSIITENAPAGNSSYHLTLAIILIFKHAAHLCLSGTSSKQALTQAELNYQKANIALKIKEQFTASYQDYSIEQFVQFIKDTNIEPSK